jgi:hypothetical protein
VNARVALLSSHSPVMTSRVNNSLVRLMAGFWAQRSLMPNQIEKANIYHGKRPAKTAAASATGVDRSMESVLDRQDRSEANAVFRFIFGKNHLGYI